MFIIYMKFAVHCIHIGKPNKKKVKSKKTIIILESERMRSNKKIGQSETDPNILTPSHPDKK